MKILCAISIVINVVLASVLLLGKPNASATSQLTTGIEIADVKEYYYTNGSVELKESLDAEKNVVMSEWMLPDGRTLAKTVWQVHADDSHRGWAFFLDDSGAIRAMFDGQDGVAHGTGFTFDPPMMPSRVRMYEQGEVVDEFDPTTSP